MAQVNRGKCPGVREAGKVETRGKGERLNIFFR